MSTAGDALGTAIKDAINALSPAQKANLEVAWQAIANPIVDYTGVPIGTITAWHKNLSGTPALPATWLECNGQTVSDAASPYDGVALPDLNGDARFLRGGSTSGTLQAEDVGPHTHGDFQSGGDSTKLSGGDGSATGDTHLTDDGGGSESRPINMSVVWVIKIK